METIGVLHMNGGVGETSYAMNSALQNKVISRANSVIREAIRDFYCTNLPKTLHVADLGCSSGPNALQVVSLTKDAIYERSLHLGRPPPEIQVFLNDLPGNDFNTLFRSLPSFLQNFKEGFGPCFISGTAGSFYGRLFPSNSLHFVHSSASLHWISQVPEGLESNKGNIFIAKTSPPVVLKAYWEQFQRDFSVFLSSRSAEIVSDGRMVTTIMGRRNANPSSDECCCFWGLLANSLCDMVSEGIIKEATVDSFNLPLYTPSDGEVRTVVEKEGSFAIDRLEIFDIEWDPSDDSDSFGRSGKRAAKCVRAGVESMIVSHFGRSVIMDDLFKRYAEHVAEHLANKGTKHVFLTISMRKK